MKFAFAAALVAAMAYADDLEKLVAEAAAYADAEAAHHDGGFEFFVDNGDG